MGVAPVAAVGVLVSLVCGCIQLSPGSAGRSPARDALLSAGGGAPAPRQEASMVPESRGFPLIWNPGETLLQGYFGAEYLSDFQVNPSGSPPIELDDDEYEVLPVVGGGAQLKLAGKSLDFGVEGFLALSGRSDLEAFASSGGSAVAVFEVDLLVWEAYGGPFVSRFIGDTLRVYAGAGPLLQWVGYDQEDSDGTDEEDTEGSGGGFYARGGFEFLLPSGKLVGLGARWSESSVDLGGDVGDLDLSAVEVFFSYAYGLAPRSKFDW